MVILFLLILKWLTCLHSRRRLFLLRGCLCSLYGQQLQERPRRLGRRPLSGRTGSGTAGSTRGCSGCGGTCGTGGTACACAGPTFYASLLIGSTTDILYF